MNIQFNLRDCCNYTPLMLASNVRLEDVALYIIQQKELYGADVDINAHDTESGTPLDYAIILGQVALAIKLLELGAKTKIINKNLSNLHL